MGATVRLGGIFGIALLVVACGGQAAPTATPAGGSPGATAPSGAATTPPAQVTPAPTAPPVAGGNECAPFPSMNPASFALPSLIPDPTIDAIFPDQIDGQPVTDVQSASWLQSICFYSGQAGVDEMKARPGGSALLANLTYGTAKATVGDESVTISAFRVAGQDANQVIQNMTLFITGLTGQTPEPFTTAQVSLGGKNVIAVTNSNGDVSYAYVIGDIVISVNDVDETQAATIFAAFP